MAAQFVPLNKNQIRNIDAYMDKFIMASAVPDKSGMYNIILQEHIYKVSVNDEIIAACKKISIELLEEMRKVHVGGLFGVAEYEELIERSKAEHGSDIFALRMIYDALVTERMKEVVIDYLNLIPATLVFKMVLIRPVIRSAIVSQYEALITRVNNLDYDTLYKFIANFLFRVMLAQFGEDISQHYKE